MTQAQQAAKGALLRALANPLADDTRDLVSWGGEIWAALLDLAIRTRSAAMFCRSGIFGQARSLAPPDIMEALLIEERRASIRSLAYGRAIATTGRKLREAKLQAVALKGVDLAYRRYPAPHFRPLRDVDLLLSASQAIEAHEELLRDPQYVRAPWAGHYGVEYGHQLPEIIEQESGLVIEIHHRLDARHWGDDAGLLGIIRDTSETVDLMGERVAVPSKEANFLHLVEHAAIHHTFSNGPLLLADLHFLASAPEFDFAKVAEWSSHFDLDRSLALVAALAGKWGASWPERLPELDRSIWKELIEAAETALFEDGETVRRHDMLRRQEQRTGGVGLGAAAGRALRPDPLQLAAIVGRTPDDWRRWFGYPGWIAEKGERFFASRRDPVVRSSYAGRRKLQSWLEGQN